MRRARSSGRHDFTAFTPTETEHVRFVRDVMRAQWAAEGELLEFWIEADTFMRHMNRVLVGTMLEVASGGASSSSSRACWRARPAAPPGRTAPAHGLALAGVSYGPDGLRGAGRRAGARRRRPRRRPPYRWAQRDGQDMLNVLLTNDDGIEAEGLQALRRALVGARRVSAWR